MAIESIFCHGEVPETAEVRFSPSFIRKAGKGLPSLCGLKAVQGVSVSYPEEPYETGFDTIMVTVKGQDWSSGMAIDGTVMREYFNAYNSDGDRRLSCLWSKHTDI
jgi:hypothetical protein